MKNYKLTITTERKTISMQTGKTVKVQDGDRYVYYGITKSECLSKAKASGKSGKREWEIKTEEG